MSPLGDEIHKSLITAQALVVHFETACLGKANTVSCPVNHSGLAITTSTSTSDTDR